jgi:hypothetical protein
VAETREEGNIQSVDTLGIIVVRKVPLGTFTLGAFSLEKPRSFVKNTLERKQLFETAGILEKKMEKEERVVIEAQHEEAKSVL